MISTFVVGAFSFVAGWVLRQSISVKVEPPRHARLLVGNDTVFVNVGGAWLQGRFTGNSFDGPLRRTWQVEVGGGYLWVPIDEIHTRLPEPKPSENERATYREPAR